MEVADFEMSVCTHPLRGSDVTTLILLDPMRLIKTWYSHAQELDFPSRVVFGICGGIILYYNNSSEERRLGSSLKPNTGRYASLLH
jgi:hypothetical protein